MKRRLKILFVLEDLCFGGTQRQILQLAQRLDRALFRPVLLTLTGPTDMDEQARGAGVELKNMGRGRKADPLFFVRLARQLRALGPDIIVPCTALPNIWGRIWGRLGRVAPVVGTCRGGGAIGRQHEWLLWRLCTHMICNSPELERKLLKLGLPSQRLTMIANGVDTEFFFPGVTAHGRRRPEILCVARLAADKDHLTLLRAFEIVHEQCPEAALRLVGEGPQEQVLRAWTASHPAAANIIFSPATADVRPWLQEARVFALASRREGQPNAILEAMSAGLPVCATDVGGIPSLVRHGESGFLSPAGDAEALAANCLRLLRHAELAAEFGARGRSLAVSGFSYPVMVAAHERVFMRCWQEAQGAAQPHALLR